MSDKVIPVQLYLRPDERNPRSRKQADNMKVPSRYHADDVWTKIEENLVLLGKYNITITAEQIPGNLVNVCLDDGDFDYKFELFPNDKALLVGITELVLNFDEADYLKAKAHMFGEEEGPDETLLGGPNG